MKEYYWTPRQNDATNRRIEKLKSEGVEIDLTTHEGRQVIGYSYLIPAFKITDETF